MMRLARRQWPRRARRSSDRDRVRDAEGTALATALMAVSEGWWWMGWYFIQPLTHWPITISDKCARFLGRRSRVFCDSVDFLGTESLHSVDRMSAPPDYYRILHVQPDAPAAIIHASYRTLLQRALGAARQRRDRAARRGVRRARRPAAARRLRRRAAERRDAVPARRRARPGSRRAPARATVSSAARRTACSACSSATTNAAAARARCSPPNVTGSSTRDSACCNRIPKQRRDRRFG